jgi:hypothetical protein
MMANATNAGGSKGTGTVKLDPSHELPPAEQDSGQGQDSIQQAKDQAKELAQGAKEQVKSLASDAKDQAKDVAKQARDHVQGLIGQQKDQAADRLGTLASALRDAGRKLNQDQEAGDVGQYADRAAGQVERLSRYLRQSDLNSLVRDTETFARRRPEVFLGGTLIAGLMLARFLKASAPDSGNGGNGSKYAAGARTADQPAWTGSQRGSSQQAQRSQGSQTSQSSQSSRQPQQPAGQAARTQGRSQPNASPAHPSSGA